ncbi:uncharacterized protein LOC131234562 [Magnolia sinica]|uniref:uncharacterized protein LOC131234562 n=1 Tax=Magnolia sinica TaxID=86752 RepID=UPI00265AD85E|nr:uncharacterized protein LOC131234562 [Magnolia sinica]
MMYRAFSITLYGSTRSWYRQLKPKLIGSFAELSRLFLTQFISGKKSRKPTTHLFTLKQGNKESLKDFIARFNEEALLVDDYDDNMALSTMFSKLREVIKEKRPRNEEPQSSSKKPDDRASHNCRPTRRLESKFRSYTPLNTSPEHILLDIRDQKPLQWPICMKVDTDQRDKRKYCCFHRDHGHNTNNCVNLKDEIETLIRKSHLRRYIKEDKSTRREDRGKDQPSKTTEEPTDIRTIYGSSSGGGDLNRAHKAYSRNSDPKHYIHLTERPRKELRVSPCSLNFTEDDVRGIQHPHDDALVVVMTIARSTTYWSTLAAQPTSSTPRPSKEWGSTGNASNL